MFCPPLLSSKDGSGRQESSKTKAEKGIGAVFFALHSVFHPPAPPKNNTSVEGEEVPPSLSVT